MAVDHVRHDLHLRHCRDIIRNGLARGGKPGDCLASRRKSGEATLCLYDRGRDLQSATCLAAREPGRRQANSGDDDGEQYALQNRESAAVRHVRLLGRQGSACDHTLKQGVCPTGLHS